MKQEQIDRINELYHKSQSVGLTDEEKEEQAALRKQYVADIKASLRGHLNNRFLPCDCSGKPSLAEGRRMVVF